MNTIIEIVWDGDKWCIPISELRNMILRFKQPLPIAQADSRAAAYEVILIKDRETQYTWWSQAKEPAEQLYETLKEAQENIKET